jgi:hypothetical protein
MSITEMVDWSNRNAGAVMGLLTAVYVIATILIMVQTRRAANLQAKAIQLTAQLEADRLRPRLLINFDFLPGAISSFSSTVFAHVSITNLGQTAALNVMVRVNPELVGTPFEDRRERRPSIVNQTLTFLAPQQRLRDLVDESSAFFARYESVKFEIEASYTDTTGTAYVDRYDIDLGPLKDTTEIHDPRDRIITSLKGAAESAVKSLAAIAETVSAPDRSALMMPFGREVPLSLSQKELLRQLRTIESSLEESERNGFIAFHVLNQPHAVVRSLASDREWAAAQADIEYLIRAGHLHGHYAGRTLRFWVTAQSPNAGQFRTREQRVTAPQRSTSSPGSG